LAKTAPITRSTFWLPHFGHFLEITFEFVVASQYAIERLASEQLKEEKGHYFQRHYYVVTKRLEDGEEVWVRAEYAPAIGGGQSREES
jgi:hypothetical protein